MVSKSRAKQKILPWVDEYYVSNTKMACTGYNDYEKTGQSGKPRKDDVLFVVQEETDAKAKKGRHQREILKVSEDPYFHREPANNDKLQKE
jgi:hypothetical protein